MGKDRLNVGILGLGTIGCGVARILLENAQNLERRSGMKIVLKAAADLDIERDRGIDFGSVKLTTNADDIIGDPEIDVVVEVIGGVNPARKFIARALQNGKHVVTSNKEVVAKHQDEFLEIARANNVNLYIEASVGGGIPIIHGLKNCLAANNIDKVFGIMNGTTNYILTKMSEEGAAFEEVLKEAQDLGYAEADPTSDVDGYDVAYKLAILGGIAFNTHFRYEDIYFEGIRKISPRDIEMAEAMGYAIKLMAIGIVHDGEVELRVHPVMIEEDHPLASVNGSFNAVFVEGNYIDQAMFYGPGAGMLPTASAVVGDVLDIAMAGGEQRAHPSIFTDFSSKKVMPIGDVTTEYYLRLKVKDQAGVLAGFANICRDHDVSIKSVHQHEPEGDEAELVIITHEVKESAMQHALEKIAELDSVIEVDNLIRVGL